MATFTRFEEIQAWQKARALVCEVYKAANQGKFRHDFSLKDQLCRAAVSGMTNIAEGFARSIRKDFAHFLDIARGSASEGQSLLYVSHDLEYLSQQQFEALMKLARETASLIAGLSAYLRKPIELARTKGQ